MFTTTHYSWWSSAGRVLLVLQCLVVFIRADVSQQQLAEWVDKSTLIFQATILASGSNVNGVDQADNPVTVRVDGVLLDNDTSVHNFGSLKGRELTVVDPSQLSGPERKPGTSAVFYVNPLMYEKNIAVTLVAIADEKLVKDQEKRVAEAIEENKKKALTNAEKNADVIVTGRVEAIKLLPAEKLNKLRLLANGYDLYSEHAPRWREAVIDVEKTTKGKVGDKVLVVFPSTEDRAWAESPKFTVGQAGTWLLHGATTTATRGATQLSEGRAKILLTAEAFDGSQRPAYTALNAEDFRQNEVAGRNEH